MIANTSSPTTSLLLRGSDLDESPLKQNAAATPMACAAPLRA
jgi:hypothetical protein